MDLYFTISELMNQYVGLASELSKKAEHPDSDAREKLKRIDWEDLVGETFKERICDSLNTACAHSFIKYNTESVYLLLVKLTGCPYIENFIDSSATDSPFGAILAAIELVNQAESQIYEIKERIKQESE